MRTKNLLTGFLLLLIGVIAFSSCVKQNFDAPPSNCDSLNITPTMTINQLKALFTGDTTRLDDSVIVEAYVTSTDQYGNFYKELVVQDSTGAIAIQIDASYLFTKYPVGQKVYLKCGGLYLGKDDGVVKLGSLYNDYGVTKFGRIQGEAVIDEHIVKTCDNEQQAPKVITLDQISDAYLYQLIEIHNVQFSKSDTGQTWADAINLQSSNHTLIDANMKSLTVRTSGYAAFARDSLPKGSGTITGILGKYNDTYQLYIRSLDDVDMDSARFKEPIFKDFEDGSIYSGGWFTKIVTGSTNWELGTYNGNYAQCSNYNNGSHTQSEVWYITPELSLQDFDNPYLSFKNACNYNGADLEVKYSTDYDGLSDPGSATWTDLNPTLSTGSWSWVNSGELTIPKNTKYIAFVYYGSDSDGKTWEIDNILIDSH